MDGWMDGWMDGRTDGRTDGWMDVESVGLFGSFASLLNTLLAEGQL